MAEGGDHLDPRRMRDVRAFGALVGPRATQVAFDLAPGVGVDEALERGRVARVVHAGAEAVAVLVDLAQERAAALVVRGQAAHGGERLEALGYRQPESRRIATASSRTAISMRPTVGPDAASGSRRLGHPDALP